METRVVETSRLTRFPHGACCGCSNTSGGLPVACALGADDEVLALFQNDKFAHAHVIAEVLAAAPAVKVV
jgi:hypothetical protein